MDAPQQISTIFEQLSSGEGKTVEVAKLKCGQSVTLSDLGDKVSLDGPALVTIGSMTITVPGEQELSVAATGKDPMVITAVKDDTTMTRTRIASLSPHTEEESGPYELKSYDEDRYPSEKKFYYDGDHFRGEADMVVIKEETLQTLLQEWFDDDGDGNAFLWDHPAKISVNHLVPRVHQIDDEIKISTGVTRKALRELVTYIRRRRASTLRLIEDCKRDARVTFDDIEKVYGVGSRVTFDCEGEMQGAAVESIELQRSMTGKWWVVVVRYIGTDGQKYRTEKQTIIIPFYGGSRPFSSLPIGLLIDGSADHQFLVERGSTFLKYATGHHYLTYRDAAVDETGSWNVRVRATGRAMVDPSSYKMMNPNVSSQQDRHYSRSSSSDVMNEITPSDRVICAAHLPGFSLTAKRWLMFAVERLAPVVFDEHAFDALVLDQPLKQTLRALVMAHGKAVGFDIITGKSEGLIFALAGIPGVGKTLTCEAVAEHLHLPLYSLSCGELGQTISDLETRLKSVLEISARWNAVTLIDEADIFMHARDDKDVVRNGFVGIFLRLLEYHQGILFLTTNRFSSFDPAFRSRISLCLEYPALSVAARTEIWKTYLGRVGVPHNVDIDKFAHNNLNGREIRALIRIAATLATTEAEGTLENDHIQRVIDIQPAFGDFYQVQKSDV